MPQIDDRLDSNDALARHLQGLFRRDPRLVALAARAGPFEVRKTEIGFAGLARVICGQQLSIQSARAIWGRFCAIEGALDARSYLRLDEAAIRASGFSAGKYRTVRVIAEAIAAGQLDLLAIEAMPATEAITALTRHKGIGPWTAEIYLMFCAGHPDIFPAGDLALRKAVGHALGMETPPLAKDLSEIAGAWAPHRAAAALLFWRYYGAVMGKSAGVAL